MNAWIKQQERNRQLIESSKYMRPQVTSSALPLHVDLAATARLDKATVNALTALQIESATVAIKSLASLAKIGELDHLGGGLDLIPAFGVTLAVTDYDKVHYTFEHAHTSIGYYGSLAAWGFLDPQVVIDGFRRGLDIPGHVSWVPGGTELNGGRLGVMVPAAVGQALGLKAVKGPGAFVICHTGDAGWISGQALNGFNAADLHRAPVTFVMHRNGIQLSGTNKAIMDKDPRPIIASLGIEILEIPSLLDPAKLYKAYREAFELAQNGRPTLIYPTGSRSKTLRKVTLRSFAEQHGIPAEMEHFAAKNNVAVDTEVWVPGSLMSYRDVHPMLECLFLVNGLPGGEGHHDGHMKGRKEEDVLGSPMFRKTPAQERALKRLRKAAPRTVVTEARPAAGSPNLVLSPEAVQAVTLPAPGKAASPRAGSEAGYAAVAKAFPDHVFVVSCDLDPSTKLGKARTLLKADHQFELSIEEQLATLVCNGLAVSSRRPQLNVVSTFSAFFEGIAREGFEMWRYQRNLNGVNEGLNVCFHLSHVGSCTGRDHFSGWSLDWITLALGYLPYLHRFYAPSDARAAFLAVKDLAAHYGGHIIGIPRDNLPILEKQGTAEPLWSTAEEWTAITPYRKFPGARKAILAFGAPAYLAGQAADKLAAAGEPVDVFVVNGLPLPEDFLPGVMTQYPGGLVTIEDGIIATKQTGLRGFASLVFGAASDAGVTTEHVGISDPRVAPSEGHPETWAFFGITTEALVDAVKMLG
jgi:transketolase N-terminal domain/subunit/transketolase C-terminal domain/subunit